MACLQLTTVESCCSCAGQQHHCLLALSQQLVHLLPSHSQVQAEWGNVTTVIAGLTNTYSSYVTTFEEYQEQRYEGASTIFGPHTLDAYIQVCLICSALPCPTLPCRPGSALPVLPRPCPALLSCLGPALPCCLASALPCPAVFAQLCLALLRSLSSALPCCFG